MSKHLLLPAVIVALAVSVCNAAPITPAQARTAAAQFLAAHNLSAPRQQAEQTATARRTRANNAEQPFYVFNTENEQGFVIIAGDDALATPVFGYSDNGTFDPDNIPPAMQAMLDNYEEMIASLATGEVQAAQHITNPAIKPIMNVHWGQGAPYNQKLPTVAGSTAVVGCVGIAMAQVMYHHKWPARPTQTIPEYTSSTYSTYRPALSPVDFQWDLMKPFHLQNSDANGINAVATLMVYVDQALQMKFGDGSSSASTSKIAEILPKYFSYDKSSIRYVARNVYTTQGWETLIYNELKANRPVIYRGDKAPGGHAFVCDGYAGDGLFHINWGWNTNSDGYFLLAGLDPKSQGTGSSDQSWGYIFDQACVVGIKPGTGTETPDFVITAYGVSVNGNTTLTRTSSSANFTANITGRFKNTTSATFTKPVVGWAIYQGNTLKSVLRTTYYTELKPNYYGNLTWDVDFGANLGNGTYYIYPICAPNGSTNWQLCEGAEANCVKVVISGNTATLTGMGFAGTTAYTVKKATFSGTMNHNKRVDLDLELNNTGTSEYNFIYLFIDDQEEAIVIADMQPGTSGTVHFNFTPSTAGTKKISISLNENGSNPFYTTTLTINQMPEYTASTSATVLNRSGSVIKDNKFSVKATVRNTGTRAYKEDVVAKLYRIYAEGGSSGNLVQTKSQTLNLALNKSTTLQFDFDNVYDGQRYFVILYYYSNGSEVRGGSTSSYTMEFPAESLQGDVNGDGKVDIDDINTLINILVGKDSADNYNGRANVDGQGSVDINDINNLINIVLAK